MTILSLGGALKSLLIAGVKASSASNTPSNEGVICSKSKIELKIGIDWTMVPIRKKNLGCLGTLELGRWNSGSAWL